MGKQEITITVDAVVLNKEKGELRVLLVQRKNDPFKGKWALPGGFLEQEEDLEAGAKRELEEETGLQVTQMHQVKAFGEPGRDPRGRIISIAFLAMLNKEQEVKGNDDASDARWFNITELPALAFDHSSIIQASLNQI